MEERKSRYELFLEEEERTAQPTKRCPKCGEVKNIETEYTKDKTQTLGIDTYCRKCKYSPKYRDREDRFWKFYHSKTLKVGDCIEWTGAYTSDGYPRCAWLGNKHGRVQRILYKLRYGDLPDDMRITTTCRNKRCVRESHLKKVTQEDVLIIKWNSAPTGDRNGARKYPERTTFKAHPELRAHGYFLKPGQSARGESNGAAKLNESAVRSIREMYIPRKMSCAMVAAKFGVSPTLISQIVRRKIWAHIE